MENGEAISCGCGHSHCHEHHHEESAIIMKMKTMNMDIAMVMEIVKSHNKTHIRWRNICPWDDWQFDINIERIMFLIAYIIVGGEIVLRALKNITRGQIFDENFLMTIATIECIWCWRFCRRCSSYVVLSSRRIIPKI